MTSKFDCFGPVFLPSFLKWVNPKNPPGFLGTFLGVRTLIIVDTDVQIYLLTYSLPGCCATMTMRDNVDSTVYIMMLLLHYYHIVDCAIGTAAVSSLCL